MNPVDNIKIKISKHLKSHSILDILLTIKCYLTNNEENPWYIFQGTKRDSIILEIKQSLDYNNHKNINDSILAMVSIKPIELILIPKNRKISLLEYIDDLIEEYSENKIIIIDSVRTNPFSEHLFSTSSFAFFNRMSMIVFVLSSFNSLGVTLSFFSKNIVVSNDFEFILII